MVLGLQRRAWEMIAGRSTTAATKEAVIIPGADHIYGALTYDQTDVDHLITITAEWFAKTL
jgi:hypothetical protein